jgi:hypothetical protein
VVIAMHHRTVGSEAPILQYDTIPSRLALLMTRLTDLYAVVWFKPIVLSPFTPNGRHSTHRAMGEPHAAPFDLHIPST